MAEEVSEYAITAYKRAWHEAHDAGVRGRRTRLGLEAAAPFIREDQDEARAQGGGDGTRYELNIRLERSGEARSTVEEILDAGAESADPRVILQQLRSVTKHLESILVQRISGQLVLHGEITADKLEAGNVPLSGEPRHGG